MTTLTPSQDNDQLHVGPPPSAEAVHGDHFEESELVDLPFDEFTKTLITLSELDRTYMYHKGCGNLGCDAIWSLYAYGMSDEAIALKLRLCTDGVGRILRPLEYIVNAPGCIKKEDQEAWAELWNGCLAQRTYDTIQNLVSYPGMPKKRFRTVVRSLDDAFDLFPSIYKIKDNFALAMWHSAFSESLNWQLSGMLDDARVEKSINEFLLELGSPNNHTWQDEYFCAEQEGHSKWRSIRNGTANRLWED